jgi:hypothetical protein
LCGRKGVLAIRVGRVLKDRRWTEERGHGGVMRCRREA